MNTLKIRRITVRTPYRIPADVPIESALFVALTKTVNK